MYVDLNVEPEIQILNGKSVIDSWHGSVDTQNPYTLTLKLVTNDWKGQVLEKYGQTFKRKLSKQTFLFKKSFGGIIAAQMRQTKVNV